MAKKKKATSRSTKKSPAGKVKKKAKPKKKVVKKATKKSKAVKKKSAPKSTKKTKRRKAARKTAEADATLKRLMAIIPPPANPRGCDVDWNRLESAIGLTYPTSFKQFVGIYGGSVWFDNVCPFFSEAR